MPTALDYPRCQEMELLALAHAGSKEARMVLVFRQKALALRVAKEKLVVPAWFDPEDLFQELALKFYRLDIKKEVFQCPCYFRNYLVRAVYYLARKFNSKWASLPKEEAIDFDLIDPAENDGEFQALLKEIFASLSATEKAILMNGENPDYVLARILKISPSTLCRQKEALRGWLVEKTSCGQMNK